ncbi:MAG: hypothetical protein ABSG33_05070 [Candidatus Bathyarchaeia archaeon]|jgi:hypothetical protein
MSNGETETQSESSLLWDCFTNWALTLEKTTQQKAQEKGPETERPEG